MSCYVPPHHRPSVTDQVIEAHLAAEARRRRVGIMLDAFAVFIVLGLVFGFVLGSAIKIAGAP